MRMFRILLATAAAVALTSQFATAADVKITVGKVAGGSGFHTPS